MPNSFFGGEGFGGFGDDLKQMLEEFMKDAGSEQSNDEDIQEQMYLPHHQEPDRSMWRGAALGAAPEPVGKSNFAANYPKIKCLKSLR